MEQDGLDKAAIGMVVLTHAHTDHCEAAITIRESNNALIAIHKEEAPTYQSLGGKVDLYLEEGELQLGEENNLKLEVFHSPGHAP
jgi:hydroxyacylglutathione hydrolase